MGKRLCAFPDCREERATRPGGERYSYCLDHRNEVMRDYMRHYRGENVIDGRRWYPRPQAPRFPPFVPPPDLPTDDPSPAKRLLMEYIVNVLRKGAARERANHGAE